MIRSPVKRQDTEIIARRAFSEIAAQFPHLKMVEHPEDPVEISITMPIQPGLNHQVWLALQNYDELHFSVGNFWLSWFPCTVPDVVHDYVDAVTGFLSGRYRILEQYRGQRCFKAELQVPEQDDWRTIGTKGVRFDWFPFPIQKTFKVITNQ